MTCRRRHLSWLILASVALGLAMTSPARATIQGTSWFPIGPAPACCFFPGGESGRATSVVVNPANFYEIWIGTANGGLWRSTDAAATWQPMTDGQASLAIGSIALADCVDTGCVHVYAGTGENAIRRDTYYGRGLLVGTRLDQAGNMQWQLRTGTPYNFGRGSINSVVLDPTTSDRNRVIYVALSSGVTASASESTVTAPEVVILGGGGGSIGRSVVDYGLYKSSDDGLNWTKLTVPGTTGYRPTDLEMDPSDHNTLYAGFLGRGIFKSTDGGATWCPLNPGFPPVSGCQAATGLPDHASTDFDHVEIAIDPATPAHLYATFGMCPDPLVAECKPSVYESPDGGQSWEIRFEGFSGSTSSLECPAVYSRYTHALTVYPAGNGNTLYLGGIRLCRSIDNGRNWSPADDNVNGQTTHYDHHAILFDAVGFRGYDVNDGGLATWQYPGGAWTPRNDGIQTTLFQSIATSRLTGRVIGGTQDNGGMMWTGSRQWTHLPCCGDGGFSVMDDDDAMKMFVTTNANGLGNLTVVPMRSTSGGAYFSEVAWGIPDDEPRSFYPPMVQDPAPTSLVNPLYFGTNRLWRSADDGDNWTPISPVLSTTPESEIFSGVDVITAIALAPSDPTRIVIGYYSGRVFATDGACDQPSCWFEFDFGLPHAPVTSLAISPMDKENVYATFSGFFSGGHVYGKTQFTVSWFPTGSIAELSGIPANWVSIEPGTPNRLWLGTDKGLYKSLNSGGSWFKFGAGLPNAPVDQIGIDTDRQRVVAATHGRGAFLLSGPDLEGYGGCNDNFVYDLLVYGTGFSPGHFCTMKLLRQDSSVCASGPLDASGGTIETDGGGVLATWKTGLWADDPGVWACLHGRCLNNIDAYKCNVPNNPLSTVLAICGNQVATAQVPGCPILGDPPSSYVSLTGLSGGFLSGGSSSAKGPGAGVDPALAGSGSFMLVPTVQSADGTTHTLCSVSVPYQATDTMTMILEHARDAVNADPACMTMGVTAEVRAAMVDPEAEDLFPHPGNLVLLAPGVVGSQLVPAVETQPGPTQGPCFDLGSLGVPVQSQLRRMRVGFTTSSNGAAGGQVMFKESSGLGECAVSVPTAVGDTADTIEAAIEAVFARPPPQNCPSGANPHDIQKQAGGLILVMSTGIQVCIQDAGVGMSIAPAETCFADADCDDGNPCTHDLCDTSGQCQHPPEPEGMPCDDLNACTFGNFCQNGTCGQPVLCDDFNSCTDDTCDPSTGACLSTPVECDDGNPCTFDTCNPDLGKCQSFPFSGATCDDGNACTVGDFCDFPPGGGTPTCHGVDACDDGNPCTADTCDPQTGGCSNVPIQCDDGNPCTVDFCNVDTGACQSSPTPGAVCDDGNACTIDDHCVQDAAGDVSCQGNLNTCDDQNLCTTDACDPLTGQCLHTAMQCDDGQGCTDDTCVPTSGQCVHTPRTCDDNDACTADACVAPACVVPDNGGGTADLPPAGCGYSTEDDLMIIYGLPAGSTITIPSVYSGFTCPPATPTVCSFPSPNPGVDCSQGTPAAGEQACVNAVLALHMAGTGSLTGFVRDIPLSISTEEHLKPRVPGSPVQSFDTEMFRLQGQLPPGDSDFDLLRVVAGSDFGLPSPGHTTLTQSGGNWAVDSFFDITYRIDFVGNPSGALSGMSGSTTGTARIRTGAGQCVHTPANCDDGDACTIDTCDPAAGACGHSPVSCDDGNACTVDSCDTIAGCLHVVPPVAEPGPAEFVSGSVISWPASPGATHWNTYRGTIPVGLMGSRLPGPAYDQACLESADAFADGPTQTTDPEIPPVGTGFYYLVSGESDCAESAIGHDSSGAIVPNTLACPTPP